MNIKLHFYQHKVYMMVLLIILLKFFLMEHLNLCKIHLNKRNHL